MYMNMDLLRKAGIKDPPKTWAEFHSQAEQFAKVMGKGYYYGYAFFHQFLWDGIAYRGLEVAVVRWETPSVDAVIAHEVGHLLGASDDADGWGIMSPHMVEAYYERQLGERAWAELGLAPVWVAVMVPLVMG